MATQNGKEFYNKSLILFAVIILICASWLAGHILRHSIPGVQNPPTQELSPGIKNGNQPGIGSESATVIITGDGMIWVYGDEGQVIRQVGIIVNGCAGDTYFTSLPAKCQALGGNLMQVGGGPQRVYTFPPSDQEK